MTKVEVMFNGAANLYEFNESHDRFMEMWGNQLADAGYFQAYEKAGRWIVINPSQCGTVEIWEVKQNDTADK